MNFVAYHSSKVGYALLYLAESVGELRAVLGAVNGKQIDFSVIKRAQFDSMFCKAEVNGRLMTPRESVARMLLAKRPITKPALERIEAMFETKGKSTEQIRAEIIRLSGELPKGHAMRTVPKKFPDRGQAIAAYTTMRQTLYQLDGKGHKMENAATETAEATPAKGKAKANGKAAAPAKAKATKNGTTAEAKTPSKAKVTKEAPAKPAKATKAAKADGDGAADTGKWALAGDALEAKDVTELRMQEGSARTAVLAVCFANKKRKHFTMEDFAEIEGARAAIGYLVKRGRLASA